MFWVLGRYHLTCYDVAQQIRSRCLTRVAIMTVNMPRVLWSCLAWPRQTWLCWTHQFAVGVEQRGCLALQNGTKDDSHVLRSWKTPVGSLRCECSTGLFLRKQKQWSTSAGVCSFWTQCHVFADSHRSGRRFAFLCFSWIWDDLVNLTWCWLNGEALARSVMLK